MQLDVEGTRGCRPGGRGSRLGRQYIKTALHRQRELCETREGSVVGPEPLLAQEPDDRPCLFHGTYKRPTYLLLSSGWDRALTDLKVTNTGWVLCIGPPASRSTLGLRAQGVLPKRGFAPVGWTDCHCLLPDSKSLCGRNFLSDSLGNRPEIALPGRTQTLPVISAGVTLSRLKPSGVYSLKDAPTLPVGSWSQGRGSLKRDNTYGGSHRGDLRFPVIPGGM